uniref:Uncharacterized protein n=1 Tax=Corethron hystrix TaxID=216773 RepID=A0A6U5DCQ3_9STRA|mmetsp:Transcript_11386/g.24992  ORF Transcript_11386/g.24992 Transcript_11386/m.24992 type:complete len:326 (+) Transcript_11386:303-1280(+)
MREIDHHFSLKTMLMLPWWSKTLFVLSLVNIITICIATERQTEHIESSRQVFENANINISFYSNEKGSQKEQKEIAESKLMVKKPQHLQKRIRPHQEAISSSRRLKNETKDTINAQAFDYPPSLYIRRKISPYEITLYGMKSFLDKSEIQILDNLCNSMMELKMITYFYKFNARSISFSDQLPFNESLQKFSATNKTATVSFLKDVNIELPQGEMDKLITTSDIDDVVESFYKDYNYILTLIVNLKLSSTSFGDVYDLGYNRIEMNELKSSKKSSSYLRNNPYFDNVDRKSYVVMAYLGGGAFVLLLIAGLTSAPSRKRISLLYR